MRVKKGRIFRPLQLKGNVLLTTMLGYIRGDKDNESGRIQLLKQQLRQQEQVVYSLFEHNPIAIGVINPRGEFINSNSIMFELSGYSPNDLKQKAFLPYVHSDDKTTVLTHFYKALAGESQIFETAIIHKEGYPIDLHVSAIPIMGEDKVDGVIIICQDITERKRSHERIRYMAYYDDMTGLPNRRLFTDRLTEALVQAHHDQTRLAVMYMDVDRFKRVNDSFGHEFGDMLLLQIAERLTRCVQNESDITARLEGDEFAVFYSGLDSEFNVTSKVQEIFKVLEEPFVLQDIEIHITVSIGISLNENEVNTAHTLMRYADIALSRAKEEGKNNFQLFLPSMTSKSIDRLTLESELRQALARQEFRICYQPQVNMRTGQLVGLEALIRWEHPTRGTVSPIDFIGLAEETGIIVQIGEWVLRTACLQNKKWQEIGLPAIPVSVNLSILQFQQQGLTDLVASILCETKLESKYLELEITESMTMDVDYATDVLLELKKLGVQISIDDFGTGYSSLLYLKKFPIDRVKIDRSFVRDMMQNPNDAAIVAAIIAMAHNLNLKVTAEGVEEQDQMSFLKMHQCDDVQGYIFSPPVPVGEVEMIIREIKARNSYSA